MEFEHHPTEEVLEQYLFGSLVDRESEQVEEHLLVCHSCIDSAEQLLSFVQSLRSTLKPKPNTKARVAGRDQVLEA
jgi:anti-sigma factor ChrR (cupin superfamily)